MVARCRPQPLSWTYVWTVVAWMTTLCLQVVADDVQYVTYTTDDGTVYLDNNRRPALYTGDFGNCQGDSLIHVTRFDASLYYDNMTVMFHMAGSTSIENEHVMMYFSVFAYGENRFDLTFNPCTINIPSLCPLNSSIPIEANGLIPIGPEDVAGIPPIAFGIPDFEGQAILRLFSSTTQSQIACYSAVMKNGNSFSHPTAVGTIIGVFVLTALIASVATTIYGQSVSESRKHYAHSVSIFVVFSILQHIFFTGSLSMNWPSVLVAFWSNFAWSAGMIYNKKMQASISQFIGTNRGNISIVGAAPNNQNFANLGGGVSPSQIYKHTAEPVLSSTLQSRGADHMLHRRTLIDSTTGFNWYGNAVGAGLPLPGNYSGFAGTLAELNIPASNAFLTGLIWLLVTIVIITAGMVLTKWTVEVCAKMKWLKTSHLDFFRKHWIRFAWVTFLRICFIAFFMMLYLTLFQLVLGGATGVIVLAAIVFSIFFLGMFGTAAYAIWFHLHKSKFRMDADKLYITSRKRGLIRWYGLTRKSSEKLNEQPQHIMKDFTWWQPHFIMAEGVSHVHDDEAYIQKFGWLSSRFRRSKWWFFAAWLVYELVRACFYGGAAGHALVQVFGLLAWEIVAFIFVVVMRPFESNRLNSLMVYLLGFSKVTTVALSSAFDPGFALNRIMTTVIGVIIIVIQGVLTICMMIAIIIGTISSYMSVTRYSDEFKPVSWAGFRVRYFDHIEHKATDKPRPPPPPPPPEPEKPKEPYFTLSSIRRQPKIEDEDPDSKVLEEVHEVETPQEQDSGDNDTITSSNPYMSRKNSLKSRSSTIYLPYGAKAHRRSWSVKDFSNQSAEQIASVRHSRMSVESVRDAPMRYRASSLRESSNNDVTIGTNGADAAPRRQRRTRSTSNPLLSRQKVASTTEMSDIEPIQSREE